MDQRPSSRDDDSVDDDFDDFAKIQQQQQTTTTRKKKGATLVCQNRALPSGAEFGVNLKSFRVPREVETFRGVQKLPLRRVHLAFVGGGGGGGGARVGEFVLAEKGRGGGNEDVGREERTILQQTGSRANRRRGEKCTKQNVIRGVKRGDFDLSV